MSSKGVGGDRKRPRSSGDVDGVDDADDDDSLAGLGELVDGDGLIASAESSDKAAARRREQRRKRLQAVGQTLDAPKTKAKASKVSLAGVKTTNLDNSGVRKQERKQSSHDGDQRDGNDDDEDNDDGDDDDDDDFDMFADSVSPIDKKEVAVVSTKKRQSNVPDGVDQQQEWDDAEGYYRATPGEAISIDIPKSDTNIQFRVMGVIGKGVFSTVLKCATESNTSSIELPPQIAIKFVRHNDTMARAAQNEVRFLQMLKSCKGIIPLLFPTNNVPFEFRGHTLLAFPHVEYNLRDVLVKFGKNVGLSLTAVRSYFQQLLSAELHLQKHRIIHSDLKPDNILVSHDFSTVYMCDFGSAVEASESVEMITPYLVSRFYRAPEIILGLVPTYAIDLWSVAVTVGELFLGRVMFHGRSNNDMIKMFMEAVGPVPNRMIRQHLVQVQKHPLPQHFVQKAANFVFLEDAADPISGKKVQKHTRIDHMTPNLRSTLMKAKSKTDDRHAVLQFEDLLRKCIALDPSRRISIKDALEHPFFVGSNNSKSKR